MGLLYTLMEEIKTSDYIKLRTTQVGSTKVLEKRCPHCNEWRPLNYYHNDKKNVSDHKSNCALCRSQKVDIKS